jgi:hypothetical protein
MTPTQEQMIRTGSPRPDAHDYAARFRHALDAIQEAQNLVAFAARMLDTTPGGNGETSRLFDRVKAHWHSIERRRLKEVRP